MTTFEIVLPHPLSFPSPFSPLPFPPPPLPPSPPRHANCQILIITLPIRVNAILSGRGARITPPPPAQLEKVPKNELSKPRPSDPIK